MKRRDETKKKNSAPEQMKNKRYCYTKIPIKLSKIQRDDQAFNEGCLQDPKKGVRKTVTNISVYVMEVGQ